MLRSELPILVIINTLHVKYELILWYCLSLRERPAIGIPISAKLHHKYVKKTQILVIGHNDNGCLPLHRKIAYDVGYLVAERGAILLTGGMGGVMRAASSGAKDAGGTVVGIIPPKDADAANEFCDIVIPTGLGLMRDFVNAYAADGIIIVGGGVGTLSEMCAAYMHNKPMVAIRSSGGMAEKYADEYLDHRKHVLIVGADSPSESIDTLFGILDKGS